MQVKSSQSSEAGSQKERGDCYRESARHGHCMNGQT